jgi:RimJ/RimL family protein N-acetyltransferase
MSEASSQPPHEPSVTITTRDGRAIAVRHIQRADAVLLEGLFYKLSPESRWRRFFVPLDNIDAEQVREGAERLATIHPGREVALIALTTDAVSEAVGVARYASMEDDNPVVEASIVLRDDYQHSGLGQQLLDLLVQTALAHGIRHVVMLTHADNKGMIALARRLGLPFEGKYSAGLYEIDVKLVDEPAEFPFSEPHKDTPTP